MKKDKIPASQFIYLTVFLVLIFARFKSADKLKCIIDITNYSGMVLSLWEMWISAIKNTTPKENKNICKFFLIITIIIATVFLIKAAIASPEPYFSQTLSDIFTLIAVTFCLCDKICISFIRSLFRLKTKNCN